MFVVHIIWHLDVGGGELFLRDLVRELARRGLRQHVFTVGPGGPIEPEVRQAGVEVTSFHKTTKAGFGVIAAMSRSLGRMRPDVVQAHGEAGALWGLAAATLAGLPSVSLMYLNTDEGAAKMAAFRVALRRPRIVVAGSADVAAFLNTQLGVPPSRTTVIPCGIDPALFPARASVGLTGPPVIASVGRLVARKGHRTLVDAFHKVLARCPTATLALVGDGVERRALEDQARTLGDRVRFLGTRFPTAAVLTHADVFVMPSLSEPQGLAILEAFACGVPVVASRTGGIVDMVEHDVSGLLAEPGDADQLASAIVLLLGDESLRNRLVRSARATLARFDIRVIADAYVEMYERALAAPEARV